MRTTSGYAKQSYLLNYGENNVHGAWKKAGTLITINGMHLYW